MLKTLLDWAAAGAFYQLVLSVPVSAIIAWVVDYVRTKEAVLSVLIPFPPPLFWPIFMAVLFLISFKPAVINPILRKRAEKQKNEQEKKQKEIDELILLVDDILKQFDVCDKNAPGINEVLKNLGTFTKDASEEKEYYDELKRMIVAVYAKVRKYDPPQLTSQDGTNIDYYIDAGAYNSLKKFFFKLRSKL